MVIVEKARKRPSLSLFLLVVAVLVLGANTYLVLIGERSFVLDNLTVLACLANALDILVTHAIVIRLPHTASYEFNLITRALWKRFGVRKRTAIIDLAISIPVIVFIMGVLPWGGWIQRWYIVPILLSPIPLNLFRYWYVQHGKHWELF